MRTTAAKITASQTSIVYPELSYAVTGLLMEAQHVLGRFCTERQYADCFETLLRRKNVTYQRELSIPAVVGRDEKVGGNRADFLIEGMLLVELKAVPFLTKRDYYQVMRYLKAVNLKLGLLTNMRSGYLKPKRILNSSHHSH